MLLIFLMVLVLIGFFALFGALIKFAEGIIRVPSSVDSGSKGAQSRR